MSFETIDINSQSSFFEWEHWEFWLRMEKKMMEKKLQEKKEEEKKRDTVAAVT